MSAPRKGYQGRAAETGGDLGCEGRWRDWIEVAREKQGWHIALHRLKDVPRQQLNVPVFAHLDLRLRTFQLRSHETLNAVAVAAGWPNVDGSEFLDNYLRVTRRAKQVVRKVFGG